jgi:hypothetical protein
LQQWCGAVLVMLELELAGRVEKSCLFGVTGWREEQRGKEAKISVTFHAL